MLLLVYKTKDRRRNVARRLSVRGSTWKGGWDTLAAIMRTRIPLGGIGAFRPEALRSETSFLYRRLGEGLAVLGVGELESTDHPVFGDDGRVRDWTFGHLCYDLKDAWHGLTSRSVSSWGLPLSRWVVPRWVVEWERDEAVLHAMPGDEEAARAFAAKLAAPSPASTSNARLQWTCTTTREDYLHHAARLMAHIQRGDAYEVNYCITRVSMEPRFDPFTAFAQLIRSSDAPYAAFHRMDDRFALCMSPERFLAFRGDRVIGEPMKGTRPRGRSMAEDEALHDELLNDPKERSENIMALDVMRHDLSQVAAMRSVQVEELCAVRSFPQVHQMVSTVSARIAEGRTPFEVVRAAFPMASMTGAPKRSAMQLIDAVEDRSRGLYSGTLGYFAPDGRADLNVVIRTVLFNAATGQLSLTTGSALTAQCDPALEWEECGLKARSVINALHHA